jgi:hypothetical protein
MAEPSLELNTKVELSREEFVHLWTGGVLSLKLDGREIEGTIELTYSGAEEQRGTRIRYKRVEL